MKYRCIMKRHGVVVYDGIHEFTDIQLLSVGGCLPINLKRALLLIDKWNKEGKRHKDIQYRHELV